MSLGSRHRKALRGVFENPVRSIVAWAGVEKLFGALGAGVGEGLGSAGPRLSRWRAVFHRPHPQKEMDKGALRSARRFLAEAGFDPEE